MHMLRELIVMISLLVILPLDLTRLQEQSKKQHGGVCPRECKLCKKAIEKSLDYLAKVQNRSGSWGRGKATLVGSTSVVLLSFLANSPVIDRYKINVEKGINFILSQSKREGMISTNVDFHSENQTALAVIALVEFYHKTDDEKLKQSIRKKVKQALRYLRKSQRGGWTYNVKNLKYMATAVDTYSVIPALVIAKNAGFSVNGKMIAKGLRWLKKMAGADGSFNYDLYFNMGSLSWRYYRTGAALFALYIAGDTSKVTKRAQIYMVRKRNRKLLRYQYIAEDEHVLYPFLLTMMGMKLKGGKQWQCWYKSSQRFIRKQRKNGSYRGKGIGIVVDLNIFRTAIITLVLQLPLDNLKVLKIDARKGAENGFLPY